MALNVIEVSLFKLFSSLEYAALGSLFEYLSKYSLDFKNILQWAKEIASGV